jgi:hypothetical protein
MRSPEAARPLAMGAYFKNPVTAFTVAVGFSSMIQCPEPGMTPSVTSSAAKRITAAIWDPNDFSPLVAITGMAVEAASGAAPDDLGRIADVAMAAWPS